MSGIQQMLLGVTPAAGGGGSAEIVSFDEETPGFGSTLNLAVPAGAATGDRVLVIFNCTPSVTSVEDNQTTGYTSIAPAEAASAQRVYISGAIGGTVPTTITITLGSSALSKPRLYVLRGASATVSDSGSISTSFSTDPRSHVYTTSATNDFAFGWIDFIGGGVTGVTGADTDHDWILPSADGYECVFGTVRATAGSYGATIGPVGAGSGSTGFWFTIAAA